MMVPILSRYGSIFIYSYSVTMILGILAGLLLTAWLAKGTNLSDWPEAFLIMFMAAIAGGRLGFVWFRWDFFQYQPAEIWQVWLGGLAYPTALICGMLALWAWTAWQGHQFLDYAALFAPALILITFSGWLACWLEGCAYGKESLGGFFSADLPDDLGVFAIRLRTQFVGMLLSIIVLILALWAYRRQPPWLLFWITLAGISSIHLLVGMMRGDPAPLLGNLRADLVVDGLLIALSLLSIGLIKNGQPNKDLVDQPHDDSFS